MNKTEFLKKVAKSGNCWSWKGALSSNGYGHLQIRPNTISAHRFSYELFNGNIPTGLWVLHKCDVRSCVNPKHLYLGTRKMNVLDALSRNRFRRGASHPCAKLTDEEIEEILWLYKPRQGALLGRIYGISPQHIWQIAKQKRRKEVSQ